MKKLLWLYDCDLFCFFMFIIKENEVWFYVNVYYVIFDGIFMNIFGNVVMYIYLELVGVLEIKEGILYLFIDYVLFEQDYV